MSRTYRPRGVHVSTEQDLETGHAVVEPVTEAVRSRRLGLGHGRPAVCRRLLFVRPVLGPVRGRVHGRECDERDQRDKARSQHPHRDVCRGAASIVHAKCKGRGKHLAATCLLEQRRHDGARAARRKSDRDNAFSVLCGGPCSCSCRSSARRCSCRRVGACECQKARRPPARRPPARTTAFRMVLHARSPSTLDRRLRYG